VKASAHSRRTSLLVGALIGLIIGAILAVIADTRARPV
jgi:gas vesicle protein